MTALAPERVAGPFKGLTPFEDSAVDALLFFGREREREVIAANLLASRLTVLYGASGVGKSSVLRAGVAHHLRAMARRNLETRGHPEFVVVVFDSWTQDPMAALVESVQAELREVFGPELAPSEHASTPTDTLHDWSNRLDCDLLLVLDQTEEYFLYHEHEEGQGTLAGELPDLVTRPGLRVSVLLAIRDDALARLDSFKGRIPNLFANYLRLDHLDRRAGRAAIVAPVEQYNKLAEPDERAAIEPELVEALLDETTTGRVDLGRRGRGVVRRSGVRARVEAPYLQLVLQRLWEEERTAGSSVLRLETLRRLGGANEVVRTHLERALAELPREDKDVAADVFSHLVTPSGTKIAHGLHDLAQYAHVGEERLEPIVSRLVHERILRPVAKRTNGASNGHGSDAPYEIFHDVLGEAVLAWRSAYESDRRIAEERSDADRRHRRVVRVLAIAFAAFVAMSTVAAYAVVQRGEARKQAKRATEQAALARQERAEAVKQEERAVEATGRAQRARRNAVTQRDLARAAEARARDQRAAAETQRGIAIRERTAAVGARNRAAASATAAVAAQREADRQRLNADRQRDVAMRQTRLAQARLLTEQARAELTVDPVSTLRLALRAASLRPTAGTEAVLRDGLLALRVSAVLRGSRGGLAGATFSRDGSLILTAAEDPSGGIRVFGGRPVRLLQRMAHGAPVRAFAVSGDGFLVATAGDDRLVRVWDARTARSVHSLPHGSLVRGLEFSPDGQLLATAADDGLARLYDVRSGLLLRRWEHPRPLRSVRFSPEGGRVVTAALVVDRFARVFDVTSDAPVASLEHGGVVTSAQFSPDGGTVVTTGRRNLFVWERGSWERRHLLTGHTTGVHGAAVSPDGLRAVSYDDSGVGRLWRLDTGTLVSTHIRHENSIESAVFSPDGSAILTSSTDLTARIWTGDQAELETSLVGHREPVVGASFDPTGRSILTASADGTARLWRASTEPTLTPLGPRRHTRGATSIDTSPDGRLVATGGVDGEIAIWRARGGLVRLLHHGARVNVVAFFDDGRLLLTAGENGSARIWRVSDGRLLRELAHGAPIRAAAAAGRVVATAGGQALRLWTAAGAPRATHRHDAAVTSVALTRDGSSVVAGSADGTARMWSTAGRAQPRVLEGHAGSVVAVAFSPTANHVATASADTTAGVWQTGSGRRLAILEGHPDALTSISFSRDGRRVLTASADGQVRSWRVTGAGEPIVFRGHVSRVSDARFSPDGRWVVTAGPSAAGLWFARSGQRIYFLRGHEDPLVGALFTGGSPRIVTASGDGTVRHYVCDVCGPLVELRALARRRLGAIKSVGG